MRNHINYSNSFELNGKILRICIISFIFSFNIFYTLALSTFIYSVIFLSTFFIVEAVIDLERGRVSEGNKAWVPRSVGVSIFCWQIVNNDVSHSQVIWHSELRRKRKCELLLNYKIREWYSQTAQMRNNTKATHWLRFRTLFPWFCI